MSDWDAVASAWDRHHDELAQLSGPVRARMLELLDPAPGDVVLELAAGAGQLSRELAPHVEPDGLVICSDASAAMNETARRRTGDLPCVSFEVVDATAIPLARGAVDAVACQMGLMLVEERDAALAECRRVLRPDGRLVLGTWGAPEANPWIVLLGAAMLACGHETPGGDPTAPGGVFSLSEPDVVREVVARAGFDSVHVETVDVAERFDSFDDYWRLHAATSGALSVALAGLDPEEVVAVRDTCRESAAGFLDLDGYMFPGQALVTAAS